MEVRGAELIARYKSNYMIRPEAEITEDMILTHWQLEKELTQKLLASNPEQRWEIFEQSYSQLYRDLNWLNDLTKQTRSDPTWQFAIWTAAIGLPPQTIYEIGSGKGDLIAYLSKQGFDCKGTEITRERGEKHVVNQPNLSWGNSDGIHLQQFEPAAHYNVVISCQVIEHLHPEDLQAHLRGCAAILEPKGRYIFSTPHRFTGPHDISAVFKYDLAQGMHLKEYRYSELVAALKQVGYRQICCPLPPVVQRLTQFGLQPQRWGEAYLQLMLGLEALLALIPVLSLRRTVAKALRRLLVFRDNIFLVAQKI